MKKIRHVLYNCSASHPKIESKTNEESREVQTETLTVKARPLASGYVKAKTGDTTTAAVYADWYKAVYLPTAADTSPCQLCVEPGCWQGGRSKMHGKGGV